MGGVLKFKHYFIFVFLSNLKNMFFFLIYCKLFLEKSKCIPRQTLGLFLQSKTLICKDQNGKCSHHFVKHLNMIYTISNHSLCYWKQKYQAIRINEQQFSTDCHCTYMQSNKSSLFGDFTLKFEFGIHVKSYNSVLTIVLP